MIVLYGDGLARGDEGGGGISGTIEVDIANVQVEEEDAEGKLNNFLAADASLASFTEMDGAELVMSRMNLIFTVIGAEDFSIRKSVASVESKSYTSSPYTGAMDKETLVNEVFGSMENSISKAGDGMAAIFDGDIVTADITTTIKNNIEVESSVELIGDYKFKVSIDNSGKILTQNEISCISTVTLTVAITKGSITEEREVEIPYKSILYRPKVQKPLDSYLYTIEGRYKLTGGWLSDNIADIGRYSVFKTDIDPITSFFRNKFYGFYDPVNFDAPLAPFAFTSAIVGEGFSGFHTVGKRVPTPFEHDGDAIYYSDVQSGAVKYSINKGVLEVDTASAESDEGFAIFEFKFPKSLYVSEMFHMPCKSIDTKPLAIAIDCKIAYDPYVGILPVTPQTNTTLLASKTFFTFLMSYIHLLGSNVMAKIMLFMPFSLATRGLSNLLSPGIIETVFQIVYLRQHSAAIQNLGGTTAQQYGWLHRSIGFQISNCSRGLSKVQQQALLDELMLSYTDEMARAKSKEGYIVMNMFGVPLMMPFVYSDGWFLKPTALGACWESDINDMYNNANSIVNDDFKALTRRHALLSHSETVVNMVSPKIGNLVYPPFSGSLTRILIDDKVNDIGGVSDPLWNTARRWNNTVASSDKFTLEGWLARVMKDSLGNHWDRFNSRMESSMDQGVPAEELNDKPVPTGGRNHATLSYRVRGAKIAHIDIVKDTVKIWRDNEDGVVYDCKIIRPNPNIILAIEEEE